MLFYSVFQTFYRKKNNSSVVLKIVNPEGPLGSYLCVVTLSALLITCQFLFCGTKKINRNFYWLKNSSFSFLFLVDFLISCFIMCLDHSLTMEDYAFFIKSIFYFLWNLIVNLRNMFLGLSHLSSWPSCLVWKCIFPNSYFILFFPGYLLSWDIITGIEF